ncbi:MAG: hypothetical protein KAT70_00620 [Thermoplasmata archaeon]|nr:hypothetical protein [Thermoplasmata archaeon]
MKLSRDMSYFRFALIVFALVDLAILLWRPFEAATMGNIANAFTATALILALIFSYLALKLYGNSAEGKMWIAIITMLVSISIGMVISIILESYDVLSAFVILGFAVYIGGIWRRIRSAGLRPDRFDLTLAVIILVVIIGLQSLYMIHYAGTVPADHQTAGHILPYIACVMAYILIFACVLMSRLMGGHLSFGWTILAIGAVLFSIYYAITMFRYSVGILEQGSYLEVLGVLSLNGITFTARFQWKKHLELIEMM